MIMKIVCYFRKFQNRLYSLRTASSRKIAAASAAAILAGSVFVESLLAEGLAVGALVHGGVNFVGAHQDAVQRAVVLVLAVVCALMDGAFDALIGVATHNLFLLLP